ncbi:MAG TPA: RNA methyltransferase [Acidimicrobiales bacterium]|nr:RNA methyltransferase [Acidimicrobiales bacterium]
MSALAYRHQRVQRLRRLVGRRDARKEEGRFVIEGVNLLEEALRAGTPIEAVYLDSSWQPSASAQGAGEDGPDLTRSSSERLVGLVERCYGLGARVFQLEPGVLARVAGTVTPQPVLAVVQLPLRTMADLAEHRPQLVVACVDVRDPGNAGTVARSAWAAGADAVVCCEGTVDLWNPKAVRSSAGAVLHIPVVAAGPAPETLGELGLWGLRRWGTVPAGGEDYAAVDLARPSALVVGNEAAGLPVGELRAHLDGLLSIPMAAGAESLNVGMAAAVLCFEAARQRRAGASGKLAGS